MITKLMESFANELQKDENKEYINNFIEPYVFKYKLIIFIFFIILLIILTLSCINTTTLVNINNRLTKHA